MSDCQNDWADEEHVSPTVKRPKTKPVDPVGCEMKYQDFYDEEIEDHRNICDAVRILVNQFGTAFLFDEPKAFGVELSMCTREICCRRARHRVLMEVK